MAIKTIIFIFLILIIFTILIIYPKQENEKIVALAGEGKLIELKEAVTNGANINAQTFDDRKTPLIAASLYGKLEVTQYLIEAGADVNLKDGVGGPLYWAAFNNQTEIYRYLVAHGARLQINDKSLSYLLREMEKKNNPELIALVKIEIKKEAKH